MQIYPKAFVILMASATIIDPMAVSAQTVNDRQNLTPVGKMIETREVHHDYLKSLKDVATPASPELRIREKALLRPRPYTGVPDNFVLDTVTQITANAPKPGPLAPVATIGLNFDGVGQGFPGFTVASAPPDTQGAVGSTQYFSIVNSAFAIFNKTTGARIVGASATKSLWAGFGGKCETANDGDAFVKWDNAAQRWIVMQFAVTPSTAPFFQCVAVSQTADATGAYFRYAFSYQNFPDYPKFAVWPDGYYITFNLFNPAGTAFLGALVCAYDRSKMLIGAAATQQCFQQANTVDSLLPSDPDGSSPVPAGSPNFVLGLTPTGVRLYKFHADFTTPANATFTGPTNITVAGYNQLCSATGTCIRQAGTTTRLDALGDRLNPRLSYRRYADGHEALVATHAVSTGLRWYEIRNPNGAPTLFQQGTYAPTSTTRWLGSVAQDKNGNFGIGYSASSNTLSPAVRFAARAPTDTLGTLGVENTVINGGGSQTGGLTRWGDYSAMVVDASDDCTFWFTSEYLKTNGSFNWSTRIANFKLAGCQ